MTKAHRTADGARLPGEPRRLCGFQKRRVDRREPIIPSARKARAPSTPQFGNGGIRFAHDSPAEGDGSKFFVFIKRIDWQTVL